MARAVGRPTNEKTSEKLRTQPPVQVAPTSRKPALHAILVDVGSQLYAKNIARVTGSSDPLKGVAADGDALEEAIGRIREGGYFVGIPTMTTRFSVERGGMSNSEIGLPLLSDVERQLAQTVDNLQEGDVLLFYFSGHGFRDANTDYLVMHDTNALESSGALQWERALPVSLLRKYASDVAKRKARSIYILDACRNVVDGSQRSVGRPMNEMVDMIRDNKSPVNVWIQSSAPGDVSWSVSFDGRDRGYFSYYFTNALDPMADAKLADSNEDGAVTVAEAFHYARTNMEFRNLQKQSPRISVDLDSETDASAFVLSTYPRREARGSLLAAGDLTVGSVPIRGFVNSQQAGSEPIRGTISRKPPKKAPFSIRLESQGDNGWKDTLQIASAIWAESGSEPAEVPPSAEGRFASRMEFTPPSDKAGTLQIVALDQQKKLTQVLNINFDVDYLPKPAIGEVSLVSSSIVEGSPAEFVVELLDPASKTPFRPDQPPASVDAEGLTLGWRMIDALSGKPVSDVYRSGEGPLGARIIVPEDLIRKDKVPSGSFRLELGFIPARGISIELGPDEKPFSPAKVFAISQNQKPVIASITPLLKPAAGGTFKAFVDVLSDDPISSVEFALVPGDEKKAEDDLRSSDWKSAGRVDDRWEVSTKLERVYGPATLFVRATDSGRERGEKSLALEVPDLAPRRLRSSVSLSGQSGGPASILVPEMILLPAGNYSIGEQDLGDTDSPTRLKAGEFALNSAVYMARTEVTVEDFFLFLTARESEGVRSTARPEAAYWKKHWTAESAKKLLGQKDKEPVRTLFQLPMTYVSYGDAIAYCKWLTTVSQGRGAIPADMFFDLPTEAEFEIACRADDRLKRELSRSSALKILAGESEKARISAVLSVQKAAAQTQLTSYPADLTALAPAWLPSERNGLLPFNYLLGNAIEWCHAEEGTVSASGAVLRGGAGLPELPGGATDRGTSTSKFRTIPESNDEMTAWTGFRLVLRRTGP